MGLREVINYWEFGYFKTGLLNFVYKIDTIRSKFYTKIPQFVYQFLKYQTSCKIRVYLSDRKQIIYYAIKATEENLSSRKTGFGQEKRLSSCQSEA